ncbi:MAG: FG-GAP-like repeat-containing protein [Kofleriaceae bacterium]
MTNWRAGTAARIGGALALLTGLAACTTQSQQYTPLPPTVPKLRMPRNDVYISSFRANALRPTFMWESSAATVKDPVRYELQLSADKAFENDVVHAELLTPSFQPDQDLPISTVPPVGRRYYWRVRACLPLICSEYSPTWWLNLGRSAKDFNGDGYADVAIGTPDFNSSDGRVEVYFGGPGATFDPTSDGALTGDRTGESFGFTLAAAGDFNADGFADLLVGARGTTTGAKTPGRGYLYFGASGRSFDLVPDVIFEGEVDEDFASALGAAGDFNGDGFSDVAIGARSNGARGTAAGRVYVYHGGTDGPLDQVDSVLTGEMRMEEFGSGISSGDLNGDGTSDLVISAASFPNGFKQTCATQIYLGVPGGTHNGSRALSLSDEPIATCVSTALATGDINHDGFNDIVRIANSSNLTQVTAIHLGGVTLTSAPDASIQTMDTPEYRLVTRAAMIGDLNGDDLEDIAIGYASLTNILLANRGGVDARPTFSVAASVPGALLTALAGDVNGDGYDDFVIRDGAEPAVSVYFGAAGGLLDAAPRGTMTNPTQPSFGTVLALRARR